MVDSDNYLLGNDADIDMEGYYDLLDYAVGDKEIPKIHFEPNYNKFYDTNSIPSLKSGHHNPFVGSMDGENGMSRALVEAVSNGTIDPSNMKAQVAAWKKQYENVFKRDFPAYESKILDDLLDLDDPLGTAVRNIIDYDINMKRQFNIIDMSDPYSKKPRIEHPDPFK